MAPTGDSGETEAFDRQESGSAPKRDGPSPSAHPATDRTDREGNRSSQPRDLEFAIDPRRVLRTLLMVTAVLVVLSTAGQVAVYYLPDFPLRDSIANLFYIRMEQNVPHPMLLLVATLLCVLIARTIGLTTRTCAMDSLSIVFVLLSFDEFASIHDQATDPLREQLGITGGPLFFAWVIPGAALVALFAIALLRFLGHLPKPTRRRLLAAGTLFISGAIGFEMIGGAYKATYGPSTGLRAHRYSRGDARRWSVW